MNRLGRRGLAAATAVLSTVGGTGGALAWASAAQAAQVVVRSGDTLTSLAARYGTTPWALAQENRIGDSNHIEIGQVLSVPGGPTLSSAVSGRGTGTSRTVTVSLGQTLTSIASRYGVTVAQLVTANGLAHPDLVQAGTRLTIPGAAAPTNLGALGGPSAGFLASTYGRSLLADFSAWSAHYGVPLNLLEALTWWESGWNNTEVSSTGAIGIGQLEPATVLYAQTVLTDDSTLDPHVPSDNIRMTAAFLCHLIRHSPDLNTAVAAYYQGLQSVTARGQYTETRHYVAGVMAYARVF